MKGKKIFNNMNNLIKVKGTYKLPYIIKAEWTAYLVFSILFGPIILLLLAAYYINPDSNIWQAVLFALGTLIIFLVWISYFKVILNSNGIFYKTLFSKGFKVNFSEINKIEIDIGMHSSGSEKQERQVGYYRFNIFTHSSEVPYTINMKPFSKRDLAILVDLAVAANPSIKLDKLAHDLYEGNFNPIASQGIRKFWQVALWIFLIFLIISLLRHLIK